MSSVPAAIPIGQTHNRNLYIEFLESASIVCAIANFVFLFFWNLTLVASVEDLADLVEDH